MRAAALERLQTTYGNRAAQRRLQRAASPGAAAPTPRAGLVALQRDGGAGAATEPQAPANAPPVAAPTEDYVVPFDRAPLSLPGEQVLFNDVFQHADPTLFKLNFTGVGGKFEFGGGRGEQDHRGAQLGQPAVLHRRRLGRSHSCHREAGCGAYRGYDHRAHLYVDLRQEDEHPHHDLADRDRRRTELTGGLLLQGWPRHSRRWPAGL